jgi:hypothetical protein
MQVRIIGAEIGDHVDLARTLQEANGNPTEVKVVVYVNGQALILPVKAMRWNFGLRFSAVTGQTVADIEVESEPTPPPPTP